ncbi:MAG: phage portal protein [Thermodesulfovibrionales bacterium]|jgi:lambda family phage portal protein
MKTTVRVGREDITIQENIIDKAIRYFDPVKANRRFRSRVSMALAGAYIGASTTRRQTLLWRTSAGDPDSDILSDLPRLRERSRDLIRNSPLATGAINTTVTNVVGTGLKLQSRLDRDTLNFTEEQADAWEKNTEREFRLWAESQECDAARTLNFAAIQDLVFRQVLENGDIFTLLPRKERNGSPYSLKLQLIEADRVCNPDGKQDSPLFAGGVEKDDLGAPVTYHILKQHPGNTYAAKLREWVPVNAFGEKTGLRNCIHNYKMLRPGQTRGVPYLAPVIESLKQIDKYTEAEIMAAVISSMLTVFIKSETGELDLDVSNTTSETQAKKTSDTDMKLGTGAILGLAPGEDISIVNPLRPNAGFDPFIMSILRQIGVALELPFEVLIKHFTASYSAARAALLEAWKFFNARRQWLAQNFCQVVYEIWLYEAVAIGRIAAPGFFTDPIIRRAYSGAEWVGPAKGQIDELKEVNAAGKRIELGISTLSEVTAEMTGGDWEKKHPQSVKEYKMRKEAGLIKEDPAAQQAPVDDSPDNKDDTTDLEGV